MDNSSPETDIQSQSSHRITCFESPEQLVIHISTPKRISFIALAVVFLVVWGYSLASVSSLSLSCCWGGTGLLVFLALLWGLVGKEIISIDENKLVVKQSIFGFGFTQTYQIAKIIELRSSPINPKIFISIPGSLEHNLQAWGFSGGSIAFDYNGKECRFGLLLHSIDTDLLIAKINAFLGRNTA